MIVTRPVSDNAPAVAGIGEVTAVPIAVIGKGDVGGVIDDGSVVGTSGPRDGDSLRVRIDVVPEQGIVGNDSDWPNCR